MTRSSFVRVFAFFFVSFWSALRALGASVIVDDRAAAVSITGTWNRGAGAAQEYLQTTTSSITAGSTMTLAFSGIGAAVFATVDSGTATTMTFSVDGGTPQSFTASPSTGAVPNFHENIFVTSTLADGAHTLLITQTNAGTNVAIDYFLVAPGTDAELAGQTIFADDQDSAVVYSGSWADNAGSVQDLQGTLHSATAKGASASITFDGTSIIVYGSIAEGTTGSMASFAIDGGTATSVVVPGAVPFVADVAANQVLFTATSLTAGQHTIVMTAAAPNVLFFDYITITGFSGTGTTVGGGTTSSSSSSTTTQSSTTQSKSTSSTSSISSSPSSSTSSSTSSSASSVTGTSKSDTASSKSKSSKTGVIIGVIVGVLVALVALMLLCTRTRGYRRGGSSLIRSKLESQLERNGNEFLSITQSPKYPTNGTPGGVGYGPGATGNPQYLMTPYQAHQPQTPESPYFVQSRPQTQVWSMPLDFAGGAVGAGVGANGRARQGSSDSRFSRGLPLVSPPDLPRSPMTPNTPPVPQSPYRDFASPGPNGGTPRSSIRTVPTTGAAHPLQDPLGSSQMSNALAQPSATISGPQQTNGQFFLSAQPNSDGYYDLGVLPGTPSIRAYGDPRLSRPMTAKEDWRTTMGSTSYAHPLTFDGHNRGAGVASPPPVPHVPTLPPTSLLYGRPLPEPSTPSPPPAATIAAPSVAPAPAPPSEKEQLAAHYARQDAQHLPHHRQQLRVREADTMSISGSSAISGLSSIQNIGVLMMSGADDDEGAPGPGPSSSSSAAAGSIAQDHAPPPSYSPYSNVPF